MKTTVIGVLLAACGCGEVKDKPDAALADGKQPDGKPADAGKCAGAIFFTGEAIDWDSTDANFCGVFNATLKVRNSSDPAQMDTTSPNGRFEMCIPLQTPVSIDVTPPTGNNPCATNPGSYALKGIAVANAQVEAKLTGTDVFRIRAFSTNRQTAFYAQIGALYDSTRGALMVHVAGTQVPIAISVMHDQVERYDGTTWSAGNTGTDVYFPNIPVGTASIQVPSGTDGAISVPIEANTITYATVVTP